MIFSGSTGLNCFFTSYISYYSRTPSNWPSSHGPGSSSDSDHASTMKLKIFRMAMGVLVQLMCGYVTLPLYALVTQMGTTMNKAVFTEGVVEGLKHWQAKAKKNLASRSIDGSTRPTLDASLNTSIVT